MSFCHIQRKLIALKPGLQFAEIAIYSLIQLSQIARLMRKTGVISIQAFSEYCNAASTYQGRKRGSKERPLIFNSIKMP